MRRLVCSALLAATSVAAQNPAAPTTSPASAPAATVPKGGPTQAEFRVGGMMMSGERSYDFANAVHNATGQIKGVEVLMRATGIGVYVRSMSGTFGNQPMVINLDARVLLFPPTFSVFGGYGKRALWSTNRPQVYDVAMGGVSSTVNIGGTGLRTHISGTAIFSPDKSATGTAVAKQGSTGIEGEAAIFYRFPKVPFFVSMGYRTEVFTGSTGNVKSPEEVRGIRVGGGIQFGGH